MKLLSGDVVNVVMGLGLSAAGSYSVFTAIRRKSFPYVFGGTSREGRPFIYWTMVIAYLMLASGGIVLLVSGLLRVPPFFFR